MKNKICFILDFTITKTGFIWAFFLIVCITAGCSSGNNTPEEIVVAQINKYKMTREDLKLALKNLAYDDVKLLKTEEGRRKYLVRLVEKEILLQEAQRLGLDKEKDFMITIEAYWEQALLKSLLKRKSQQISDSINIKDKMTKQQKETAMMDMWIEELKERSFIKINEDVVKKGFF